MTARQQGLESSGKSDENRKTKSDQKLKLLLSPIRLVVGVVTLFGAFIGVWQWIESRNSIPSILVKISDAQYLTRQTKVSGLKCSFEYNNQVVEDLWAVKVTLVNTCSRNIIGIDGGDLMLNDIRLGINDNYRIVSAEPEMNDLNMKMACMTNSLSFTFDKWRPGEQCSYRIYCECASKSDAPIRPDITITGDPLRQGKIQLEEDAKLSDEGVARRNLLKYLPKWVWLPTLWSGVVFYGIVSIIGVVLVVFIIPWVGIIRRSIWRIRYGQKFRAAAVGLESFDATKGYVGIPIEFWQENNIPRPILHLRFIDDVPHSGIVVLLLIFIFAVIAFFALLALV